MMDDPTLEETSEDPYPAPSVSSFTAVNHPTTSLHPQHEDAATKSKSANKPRPSKRQKTQSSAATTAPKPKKAPTSKKTKGAKTAAQLDSKDISQGFSRTKPTSSRDGRIPVKAGSSFGDVPLEQDPGRIGDKPHELKVKPAFNNSKEQSKPSRPANDVFNQASPPTPPKSDEVEADITHDDLSYSQHSATKRQGNLDDYVEPSIQESLEIDSSIIVRDFGAPPFTQNSPPRLQGRGSQGTMMADKFDPLDLIPADLIEIDDTRGGDHGDDDFPMDDDCLEEIMQSMALPVEGDFMGLDRRPQDFSGTTLCIDEQLENDQLRWPRDTSDRYPDGVAIYEEDRTLVTSDIIDVCSSALKSSQASCVIARVAGNAISDRTRASEGSQNCFDDSDLDDDLIDLTVEESKTFKLTSPATPAKRALSPKLQWLSPKSYTPAKSSRTPVSHDDHPHLVPVDSHGNAIPFTRPLFPKAVQDRSPIPGLTNRVVMRICFRIGEALNAAAAASRGNIDAIIELYARVVSSSREARGGYKQYFQFGDLFTDRPPYLSGTYNFWKGDAVWDNDSKRLVGEEGRGKMVRVMGRIKKTEAAQGQVPGVEMVVLSIWEVDWEDVGVAKGTVCPKES